MTATESPWVIEVGDDDFEREVIERSREVPVVVDFWAEWCGPCRFLGPILEKLAEEWNGGFVLAKVDVDAAPVLAQTYRVQSIPAVKSFRDGALGPEFIGALPEPAVRQFLSGLVPSEADVLVEQAEALGADDGDDAEALLRKVIALAPNNANAAVGLAERLVARNELEEAKRLVAGLVPAGDVGSRVERLQASIFFREQHPTATEEELRDRVHKDPKDAAALLDLGRLHAIHGRYEEALETLLQAGQADRELAREHVKELMVKIFCLAGERSELSDGYRSKLSQLLY